MISLKLIHSVVKDPISQKQLCSALGVTSIGKFVVLYYTSGSDKSSIRIAKSSNGFDFSFYKKISGFKPEKKDFSTFLKLLKPRANFFDNSRLTIENVAELASGNLVVYHSQSQNNDYYVGVALFSKDPSPKIIWRSDTPLWDSPSQWSDKAVTFAGLVYINNRLVSYWNVDNKSIYSVVYPHFKLRSRAAAESVSLKLEKVPQNPILKPAAENPWEAFNVFNPAAIYEGGKVHILYRAQGFNYVSVVGYASSQDGLTIDERHAQPIYLPKEPFEFRGIGKPSSISHFYSSGGGFGGVEDPRITKIDNRIYMTYVAYDGESPPRVALTSISLDDFLNHRWLWEKAVLISPPNVVDKSCVIFPEKINGKYVIMHRIFPNILIDYVDNLNFDGTTWLKGEFKIPPRLNMWDSRKIGAGAPPIKTKAGWLLIYQSVDDRDAGKYLIGAMLLDLNDPTKVLHRSKLPILRPTEHYENVGFKAGVVYPCGAVVIGDTLFVYYGGADSYVCVATANLDDFLNKLTYTEDPILEPTTIGKITKR